MCSYRARLNGLNVKLTNLAANLEVKSKAPNGVAFTVKGKSDHKTGAIGGQVPYPPGELPLHGGDVLIAL